jgi:hypothetical protein
MRCASTAVQPERRQQGSLKDKRQSRGSEQRFSIEVENVNQSRVRVTAPQGWAVIGRALDSSPASSLSGPIRHRAPSGSKRVRIEARDESTTQEKATATAKTTAKTKTPLRKNKCKSKDKNLDNTSRLIEAPEGKYFHPLHSHSG